MRSSLNMGTDICLPVGKYSHATGVRDNNTVPWSHLASTSLFIIVKGTDSAAVKDEKLMLRIVQGSDVLVGLPLLKGLWAILTVCRKA